MITTTTARTSFATLYQGLEEGIYEVALSNQRTKANEVLEAFKATHGITTDNLVEQTEGDPRLTVRSWPSVEIAQAWVDCVLRGDLSEGLDYPPEILSSQVDTQ